MLLSRRPFASAGAPAFSVPYVYLLVSAVLFQFPEGFPAIRGGHPVKKIIRGDPDQHAFGIADKTDPGDLLFGAFLFAPGRKAAEVMSPFQKRGRTFHGGKIRGGGNSAFHISCGIYRRSLAYRYGIRKCGISHSDQRGTAPERFRTTGPQYHGEDTG